MFDVKKKLHSFRLNIFKDILIFIAVFQALSGLPKYIFINENILIFYFLFKYINCYQDCLKWSVCHASTLLYPSNPFYCQSGGCKIYSGGREPSARIKEKLRAKKKIASRYAIFLLPPPQPNSWLR